MSGGGCVTTGSVLGSGGEATIYSVVEDSTLAAKRYTTPTPERSAKLRLMIACQPHDPMAAQGHTSICWPTSLLTEPNGTNVGFLMPRIDNAKSLPLFEIWSPKSRRCLASGFTWKHLFRIGSNLASVVAEIHAKGYVIGDFNESNVLVSDRALVSIVDCDSMQVRDSQRGRIYRCLVGKPDFTAPELVGHSFQNVDRTPEQDRFALAVMLFTLLMEGTHPFSGVWRTGGDPPPIEERIRLGASPYVDDPRVRVMPGAPPFSTLDGELQGLFKRAFGVGTKNPSARPDAREWQSILAKKLNVLLTCRQSKSHLYLNHLSKCPWCERKDRIGSDPFPGSQWQQPPLRQVPMAPQIPLTNAGTTLPGTPAAAIPFTNPVRTTIRTYSSRSSFVIATLAVAACLAVSLLIAPYLHAWSAMALTGLTSLGLNAWLLKPTPSRTGSIQLFVLGKLPFAACASLCASFFSILRLMIDRGYFINFTTINLFVALARLIPFVVLTLGFRIAIWPYARRVLAANGNGLGFSGLVTSGLILSFLGFWLIGSALPRARRAVSDPAQTIPSVASSSTQAEQQIRGMIASWASAHSANDITTEASFYAPKVESYFAHRRVSRTFISELLQAAINKGNRLSLYRADNVQIQMSSTTKAIVALEKVWTSSGATEEVHHTQSQLGVANLNGTWLISSEKDLSDRIETTSNDQPELTTSGEGPTTEGVTVPEAPSPAGTQPQSADSQSPPVSQTQNLTAAPPTSPESPVDITGTLDRIDSHSGQMFYNLTNTSSITFPAVTKMQFYSDSGRIGQPRGLVAKIPPLQVGQSGQVILSISYDAQESFGILGDSFGMNQGDQVFCRALASRFAGYAGVVLETNSFRIKMRFPCQ